MAREHRSQVGFNSSSAAENIASASASVSESFEVVRLDEQSSVVRVEGAELPFRLDDAGAWVEAEALGQWLGYARPRKAKEFALQLMRDGILNDSEVCPLRGQTSSVGGRPAREVWLSRSGALKLAARSDTPRARVLLDLIVRVFEAVLDRKVVVDSATLEALRSLRALTEGLAVQVKTQAQEIKQLRAAAANDVGEVSREWVQSNVLAPLVRIARLEAGTDDSAAVRRARRSVENRVRNIVCFNGAGSAWIHYPRDAQLLRILQRTLATMEQAALDKLSKRAREQAEARAKAEVELRMKQLGLFDGTRLAS